MKVVLLSPRNDLSGNRKLITMLAHQLGQRHAVRILYPVVPDRAFLAHRRQGPSRVGALKTVLGDVGRYVRHPAWRYAALCDGSDVSVEAYWRVLPTRVLASADTVVYFSPYQALELSEVAASRAARVFYAMHDHTRTDAHLVDVQTLRQAYQAAEHVIALSEETRRHLLELGVHSEAVVPAGVDPSIFYPAPKADSGPLRILGYYWPGEPRKGAEVLRQALQQIRARHPHVAISLLASSGARLPGYDSYSELSEPALAALYRRHDIFVYPNTHGGGFGLPPLEAMASGCAVVATKVGAIEDYAQDGVSALLCDPNSADQLVAGLERLIREPDMLLALRTRAVEQAQEWSWRQAAEQMERYLTTVVGDRVLCGATTERGVER